MHGEVAVGVWKALPMEGVLFILGRADAPPSPVGTPGCFFGHT